MTFFPIFQLSHVCVLIHHMPPKSMLIFVIHTYPCLSLLFAVGVSSLNYILNTLEEGTHTVSHQFAYSSVSRRQWKKLFLVFSTVSREYRLHCTWGMGCSMFSWTGTWDVILSPHAYQLSKLTCASSSFGWSGFVWALLVCLWQGGFLLFVCLWMSSFLRLIRGTLLANSLVLEA